MKIVNKQEFYKLPDGTLFSHFEPIVFHDLCVKRGNICHNSESEPSSYTFDSILGNVDCSDSGDYAYILFKALENGNSFKLDFDCTERDSSYNDDELFAVYEKEDVIDFIKKLEFCKSIL